MKLDVHRQVHRDSQGKRVVTIEGIDVCLAMWRHILGVPKSTFHRFNGYIAKGEQAHAHGNLDMQKPRMHTS